MIQTSNMLSLVELMVNEPMKPGASSCYLELLDKLQNEYAGLMVLYSLLLLNSWLIEEMKPA